MNIISFGAQTNKQKRALNDGRLDPNRSEICTKLFQTYLFFALKKCRNNYCKEKKNLKNETCDS